MPDYKYRAALRDGKIIRGKMIAQNKTQVINKLKLSKIQPISVKRMNESKIRNRNIDVSGQTGSIIEDLNRRQRIDITKLTLEDIRNMDFHPFKRVTSKDIIIFVNNLYILKKAKFNNIQALKTLYDGTENPAFKDIVEDLLIGVEAGERLNTVMANYPKVFPPMFVNFVRVGEESGSLDESLMHARKFIEDSDRLKHQIRAVLIPKVVQFVAIMSMLVVALLIGVPMIQDVYDMFGSTKQIPAATQFAVNVVNWIIDKWYIVISILAILIFSFVFYINTPKGRYNWHKFILNAPVIGTLNKNILMSKFFQAMLLNLKNGMRIQESLEVSKNISNNYYFLSILEVGKANSLAGGSWIEPFEEKKLFKPMVTQMLSVGMKTSLTEMMEKVNDYINMEIDESISKFVKELPDITYAIVGVIMIVFMIVVMVPLIDVYMGGFIQM